MPSVKDTIALLLGQALLATASPVDGETVVKRQCPGIHVFGARETTVSQGYGSSATVVNLVIQAHPGTTSEAIVYPACGGQASCGGISYANSVVNGTNAAATAINNFHNSCPDTQLVLVGYSQGAQIFDNALCGGGDPGEGITNTAVPLTAGAVSAVKAAIFMGDPRNIHGLPYNVGTCTTQGFDARPAGFVCPSASKIKSYCDSADPYCCTGNDPNVHQGYGQEYGQQALAFINSQLSSGGSQPPGGGPTSTSRPTSTRTGSSPGPTQTHWGQCGGQGWSGPTQCESGTTCQVISQWYSQCL
ncbi:carbohydrate-binding module family 1 protein [Trichoderma aethiopicum]